MADLDILVIEQDEGLYHKLERLKKTKDVKWICEYPFTVDFGALSPLHEGSKVSGKLQANGKYESTAIKVDAEDSKTGAPVKYKYTIAVFKPVFDASGNVDLGNSNVLIEDPEIIIDP